MPTKKNRRELIHLGSATCALSLLMQAGCTQRDEESNLPEEMQSPPDQAGSGDATERTEDTKKENRMKIQYLEIVSPEADAVCKSYEQMYGVQFGEPDAYLGNARTAKLADGGMLGVRAPLREDETPVVRPYVLVEDIAAAVAKAEAAGAKVAIPSMELPGHGICAIVIQGGIEHGLWQLKSAPE